MVTSLGMETTPGRASHTLMDFLSLANVHAGKNGKTLIFIFFWFVKEPIVHEINKGEIHIKILGVC